MKTRSTFRLLAVLALVALGLFAPLPVNAAGAEDATATDIQQVSHCCEPTCECGESGCADGCCCDCERKVCVATVEKEKVEKHCWKTETKDVCIPEVVLPWQEGGSGLTIFNFLKQRKGNGCGDTCCGDACGDACCDDTCCVKPRCGKVITVCDLKKNKYEKEECVYKWKVRRLPPCCGEGCCTDGCCNSGCCGDVGCGDTCGGDACCDATWGANVAPVPSDVQLVSLFTLEPAPAKRTRATVK